MVVFVVLRACYIWTDRSSHCITVQVNRLPSLHGRSTHYVVHWVCCTAVMLCLIGVPRDIRGNNQGLGGVAEDVQGGCVITLDMDNLAARTTAGKLTAHSLLCESLQVHFNAAPHALSLLLQLFERQSYR